eukprot:TRINITY_DN5563_c0_g1_i1.p2 TRINITY_DN5563_c0_g1~~TRINITY_DN5563_c0_g1_i1.p2  ORF type:complete len:108 (+),score=10.83 TRINITY_DN5563_c0_g1_i1:74-397(+)
MNPFRGLKETFKYYRSAEFEKKVTTFVDKHRVIQKALWFGITMNAVLAYSSMQKITALRKMQEYIDEKKRTYEARVDEEKMRIAIQLRNEGQLQKIQFFDYTLICED